MILQEGRLEKDIVRNKISFRRDFCCIYSDIRTSTICFKLVHNFWCISEIMANVLFNLQFSEP